MSVKPFSATAPVKALRGSATSPSVTFTGDGDTGLYSSGDNELSVTTGGNQKAKFDSNGLEISGEINLDDGGTYATTLQLITPTANRTISFPDATGTVGLVGGSSGQLIYNAAGAYAGAPSTSVGASGDITLSLAGAASTPPVSLTGSWFSGGTSTTTKPQLLIEPTGTTSTAWNTSGTGLGVNAASGFTGNLLDLQVNGTSTFFISPGRTDFAGTGNIVLNTVGTSSGSVYARQGTGGGTIRTYMLAGFGVGVIGNETSHPLHLRTGNVTRLTLEDAGGLTVADANDIAVGTTTGTKIGTATTQKLGFYNATPVVQPTAVADITTTATSGSLPTPDGTVTIADATTPTVTELLEYCVELEAKLEAALGHLRTLGLIAT